LPASTAYWPRAFLAGRTIIDEGGSHPQIVSRAILSPAAC